MNYNLINLQAFKELSKIIKKLYVIHDDYEYFSTASVNIIIDLTITVLNCTADVIISDGEFVGVGDYACKGVKHDMDKDELLNFIHVVEDTRRKIADDNQHLLQD